MSEKFPTEMNKPGGIVHSRGQERLEMNKMIRGSNKLHFYDENDYSKGFYVVDYWVAFVEKYDLDCQPGDLCRLVWFTRNEVPEFFPKFVSKGWMIQKELKSISFAYGVWLTLSKLGLLNVEWGDSENGGYWSSCYDICRMGNEFDGYTIYTVDVPFRLDFAESE